MIRGLVVFVAAVLAFSEVAAQNPNVRSAEIVRIGDTDYYLHTVAPAETVYSLSRLYGVTEERFYEDNPQVRDQGLKAGEVVRVMCVEVPEVNISRRRLQRTFANHTVQPGETAYSIAKRYSLSISTLIRDNPGLDPSHLRAGEELLIRKSEMDKTSPQQILSQLDEFAATLSGVSDEYAYHLVEMGETLYSISREYRVSIADIEANNSVQDGLRAGVLLKIPIAPAEGRVSGTLAGEIPETSRIAAEGGFVDKGVLPGRRRPSEVLNISLLLPLSEEGEIRPAFMEFYQGALLAAEELRKGGYDLELNLFNTERSVNVIDSIVSTETFRNSDIIIGPVYEEGLPAVMEFSHRTGVPVVSPLADLEESYEGTLYQLSPDPQYRYDKMKELVTPGKNIVFITSDVTDSDFESEMKEVIGNNPYQTVHYRKGTPSYQIDRLIGGRDTENVFVVVAADEAGVDLILAALSSVQNSRLARSVSTGPIKVVGNSKWLRFRNLDRSLLFKLNASFVTSYHADRGNTAVVDFDNRYIENFGRVPTLYSYRGYDAVKLFAENALKSYTDAVAVWGRVYTPLQTPYRFTKADGSGNINDQWVLVSYSNDYTINVR